LEKVLLKFPNHPGAHHLYIHLVEASPTPELALPSAKFLETAMPGAGHIVHMPAHIYVRVGDYSRSIDLNVQAAKVDEDYLSFSANQGMYRLMYYPHNIDFITFSSYMEGRSNLGILTALKLAYKGNYMTEAVPGFSQYLMVEPMIAYTRFGKWTDILALPDPGNSILYAQVMWRFSRGLAFLRSGYEGEATDELVKLDSLNSLDTLKSIYITFNPVSSSSQIASSLLRGEILLKQKKFDQAIIAFQDAVKNEDELRYNEPPDWKIPARHFLGAALFEAGKFAEAEQVYLEDLKRNRENGWALTGLQRCQNALGRKSDVAKTAKRFAQAWKNSDIALTTSRF
jgi:tetratricopeptide (TPR) repeat protein